MTDGVRHGQSAAAVAAAGKTDAVTHAHSFMQYAHSSARTSSCVPIATLDHYFQLVAVEFRMHGGAVTLVSAVIAGTTCVCVCA